MNDPSEAIRARALAVALDTTIAALARKPLPKRLTLDDALVILESALGKFAEFDTEPEVGECVAELWKGFEKLETVIAEIDMRPVQSVQEPYDPEAA